MLNKTYTLDEAMYSDAAVLITLKLVETDMLQCFSGSLLTDFLDDK